MNVCTFCLGVCNCVAAVFDSVSVASFTELCQFQFGQKEKEMKELCIRVSRDEESKHPSVEKDLSLKIEVRDQTI